MPGWTKYCDHAVASFILDQWEQWPGAGVCVAHGRVIGLDVDTDRDDVAAAVLRAIEPSPVKRRGSKGYMGYYRPGGGLDDLTARVRWYDGDSVVCEILLHGTQSVIPPTVHPDTDKPYQWLTDETLTDTSIDELPELTGDHVKRLDSELGKLGLTRKAPRRARITDYERPGVSDHDLEVSVWRSLNNRALEPSAIDQWWPALDMPKTRQRGVGAWEAVPFWRPSGSGRPIGDRNPNLRAVPSGIVDFGADRSYTPINVVMAARDCSDAAAKEWLEQYVRGEDIRIMDVTSPQPQPCENAPTPSSPGRQELHHTSQDEPQGHAPVPPERMARWLAAPVFHSTRSYQKIKPVQIPMKAEFEALVPREIQPFPIANFGADCPGLLGQVATHLDDASATATEAGGLAIALPLLGAVMGRAYATPTGLRTNIYSVALGGSGTGKTSLVNPAKELMRLARVEHIIGQDRIASGSGLLKMLVSEPTRICFLDEFGHMLQQIGLPGSGVHAKQIVSEFTQLFSAARSLYTGTAYATREPEQIDCPHLCLFGMATPDQFWRAFGSSSLEDGSIARYLIFPIGQAASKDPDFRFQGDTSDAIRDVTEAVSSRVSGNLGHSELCTARMTGPVEKARHALIQTMDGCAEYAEHNAIKGAPAILRRVAENAIKIALISAVGRDPVSPVIEAKDFDIGHAIARWSANTMITNIASHIADNQLERDVNDVERFVRQAGEKGRVWRELQRRFRRIRKRDLQEIIEGLEEEGSIRVHVERGQRGGHPLKTLLAT